MTPPNAIDLLIKPRMRDLGGFSVGRVLPYAKKRSLGPFVFFDQIGPADFEPGTGIDVRPHPHIGLATITFLFNGELRHRDNLGNDQVIRPGDVNWMTAGRGIVHSERTDDAPRRDGQRLYGIQSWVALPEDFEMTDPSFFHHAKDSLPTVEFDGVTMTLIAGNAFDKTSPVHTFSPMFYLAGDAQEGAEIPLPEGDQERGLYLLSGALEVNGEAITESIMLVIEEGQSPNIIARGDTKFMLLGGAPIGERHIWWNLVASSEGLIAAAKQDWTDASENGFAQDGRFTLPEGENEFIPTPEA